MEQFRVFRVKVDLIIDTPYFELQQHCDREFTFCDNVYLIFTDIYNFWCINSTVNNIIMDKGNNDYIIKNYSSRLNKLQKLMVNLL